MCMGSENHIFKNSASVVDLRQMYKSDSCGHRPPRQGSRSARKTSFSKPKPTRTTKQQRSNFHGLLSSEH